MRLLILGPPGAGKGTQAARIAEALRIPAISTGDIFRSNIKNQTPLGRKVQAIIEAGHYAVSYTHLDVYKRQALFGRRRRPGG